MLEKKIDHIAYQLKLNKDSNRPGAIVFVGAGCSVSAGIPTAKVITEHVLELYKDHPDIKCMDNKMSYVELMKCLGPTERKKLFKKYVDQAKINVSHIYLAHLLSEGYVDYILTVNFDNLTQRALALYNIFPPIYDISILKDLTTTTLDTKSVTYLHGQHNGLWQLNTEEEMEKVSNSHVAYSILSKITNDRLWIVVGYSGDDFIFDQLVKLGRFDNGLYWIGYKEDEPSKAVQEKLLNESNMESFWVKGFDADSFFLKLNAELKNDHPPIFDTPFSFLSGVQENIKDIADSDEYKMVKERLVASKEMVKDAINRYEKKKPIKAPMSDKKIKDAQLKKALIDCLINEKYDDLEKIEKLIKDRTDIDFMSILASAYWNWGNRLGFLAKTKSGFEAEDLYRQTFGKYHKAIEIKPDMHEVYNNWGYYLEALAETKTGLEAEGLFKQAFEKYGKAVEIEPNISIYYNNWGIALGGLSRIKTDSKSEDLLKQAFEKYGKAIEIKPDMYEAFRNWGYDLVALARATTDPEAKELYIQEAFDKYGKAIEIKPDMHEAYNSWGIALRLLAETKTGLEAEGLFKQAFKKFEKAVDIRPNSYNAYVNWGTALALLAMRKNGQEAEALYNQAFEKYGKAVEIKPDMNEAYNRWGIDLGRLAQNKPGPEAEELFKLAFDKLMKAFELGGKYYNLACYYAVSKKNIEEAFRLLEVSLQNKEIGFEFVEADLDWNDLREEQQYKRLKHLFHG